MDYLSSPNFESHVRELLKDWHVPGLALAFVANDKTFSKAFGYASVKDQEPCTPDSLFDIASCSKSFTAASVAILVHDTENHPEVKWTAPMSELLPDDFVMTEDEYTKGITVEDILSHRTGLPGHDSSYLGQSAWKPDTAASVTRNLRNLQITAPIRSKWQYCNMFFTVATHLVETHVKLSFAEHLHNKIFLPLGMKSTYLHHTAARAAGAADRLTCPHSYNPARDAFTPISWTVDPEAQGAGSICTSANDMILYIQAMINQTAPFTPEIFHDLITPRIFTGTPLEDLDPFTSYTDYALGWQVYFYRGYQVVRHDGGIPGFKSTCFFLPLLRAGGVVLGNSSCAMSVCKILAKEFIDAVLRVPKQEKIDWIARERKLKDEDEAEGKEYNVELRTSLFVDGQVEPQALDVSLETYTGLYHNAGYHTLRVEVREGRLFIDARDRSMGFTLSCEHIHSQRTFIATLVDRDDPEDTDDLRAEFEFGNESSDQGAVVVRMGLRLEPEIDDCIWFDKTFS